jgi:16S rRNA processing protein RimM
VTDEYVAVGRVRKPHGIHGELVVEPMCDEPDAMFAPGRRFLVGHASDVPDPTLGSAEVTRSRPFKEGLLVSLRALADRTAAEAWRGRTLLVAAADLPPLAEGDAYVRDLIGMRVNDVAGGVVGDVRGVLKMPQGLLLEIQRDRGVVHVPFVDAIVVRTDMEARVITIAPPEGLLDL